MSSSCELQKVKCDCVAAYIVCSDYRINCTSFHSGFINPLGGAIKKSTTTPKNKTPPTDVKRELSIVATQPAKTKPVSPTVVAAKRDSSSEAHHNLNVIQSLVDQVERDSNIALQSVQQSLNQRIDENNFRKTSGIQEPMDANTDSNENTQQSDAFIDDSDLSTMDEHTDSNINIHEVDSDAPFPHLPIDEPKHSNTNIELQQHDELFDEGDFIQPMPVDEHNRQQHDESTDESDPAQPMDEHINTLNRNESGPQRSRTNALESSDAGAGDPPAASAVGRLALFFDDTWCQESVPRYATRAVTWLEQKFVRANTLAYPELSLEC